VKSLSASQYETLLGCIERLQACRRLEDFPRMAIAEVKVAVACDSASYREFDFPRKRAKAILEPAPPNFETLLARWQRCFDQNPILSHAQKSGDGSAHRISDFLTAREFHRLELYTEVFMELRIEHQIAFSIGNPGSAFVGIALNRTEQDFSESEREMLNRLRPHLAQTYARLVAHVEMAVALSTLQIAVEDSGEGFLLVSDRGVVLHVSARAAQCLGDYFGWDRLSPLPAALESWIGAQRSFGTRNGKSNRFIREADGRRLHARVVDRPEQWFAAVFLTEEIVALEPEMFAELGLTPTESRVLAWLTQGKSNREIAAICQSSPETVKKHIGSILAKLDVENRTAAALKARERLSAGG